MVNNEDSWTASYVPDNSTKGTPDPRPHAPETEGVVGHADGSNYSRAMQPAPSVTEKDGPVYPVRKPTRVEQWARIIDDEND